MGLCSKYFANKEKIRRAKIATKTFLNHLKTPIYSKGFEPKMCSYVISAMGLKLVPVAVAES